MNLPSSLALSQSRLFQSRLGILLAALVVVAIGAGLFLMRRNAERPAVMPTPASSPAAQVLSRGTLPPPAHPQTAPRAVYGPPAPDWAITQPAPTASLTPTAGAAAAARVAYGPPAPDWAITRPAPAPVASAPPVPAAPAVPQTSPAAAVATTAAPAPAATATSTSPATAVTAAPPAPATAVPLTATATETAKSMDASVLFAREQYVYTSGAHRDPFQSLIDGKFQAQTNDANLVDVGDIHRVGIMWGSSDKFALVEDSRGHGYVLRVGDPVVNGYISGISKTDLQIVQNAFGDSQTLSIHLQPKEGDKNATRN